MRHPPASRIEDNGPARRQDSIDDKNPRNAEMITSGMAFEELDIRDGALGVFNHGCDGVAAA